MSYISFRFYRKLSAWSHLLAHIWSNVSFSIAKPIFFWDESKIFVPYLSGYADTQARYMFCPKVWDGL